MVSLSTFTDLQQDSIITDTMNPSAVIRYKFSNMSREVEALQAWLEVCPFAYDIVYPLAIIAMLQVPLPFLYRFTEISVF